MSVGPTQVDQNLRPWLLEVNHAPSFASGSALDRRIKRSVLEGAFHMLCPTAVQVRGGGSREDVAARQHVDRPGLWTRGEVVTARCRAA